jgi:hypothetical protein
MSVSPSSVPNTKTKYVNPVSTGVEDMRGLLVSLEKSHTENPLSMSRLNVDIHNIGQISEQHNGGLITQFAQAVILLKKYTSDEERIKFFDIAYMIHYLNPWDERVLIRIISTFNSIISTIEKIMKKSKINYDLNILLRNILVNFDEWYTGITEFVSTPSHTPNTVTNGPSHSNIFSEDQKRDDKHYNKIYNINEPDLSSKHRKLLPSAFKGHMTVPNIQTHTNTSSERRQGSIAWLDKRGLYYIKHNEKRVNFIPYPDQNKNLPRPWTWYQRHGLVYFTPDGGKSEYTQVQSPNSRIDPRVYYPGYTRVGDLFIDYEDSDHLSSVEDLQVLLMSLKTIQMDTAMSKSKSDFVMDPTIIKKISDYCDTIGFELYNNFIPDGQRIQFFELGYMLVHSIHKKNTEKEILNAFLKMEKTLKILQYKRIDSNISKMILRIDQYMKIYLSWRGFNMYDSQTRGVANNIDTQEFDKHLADPVDQVRPCRCRGCTGCDGKPGHCRCIGRCRCVHDAGDARDV